MAYGVFGYNVGSYAPVLPVGNVDTKKNYFTCILKSICQLF